MRSRACGGATTASCARLLGLLSFLSLLAILAACGSAPRPSAGGRSTPSANSSPAPVPTVSQSGSPAATALPTAGLAPTAQPSSACSAGAPPPAGAFPLAANFATALALAPDGRLFWAERSGTVRVYQGGASKVFATVSTVTTESGGGYSERGLLGLALSPSFAQDHFVYAFYSNSDRSHQSVIRWTDCGGSGGGPSTIVTLPSGSDCCHKGGRLAFGSDGKLYVTLGEEHDPAAAQSTSDLRGKLLRYNPDGTIPADNPFGPSNPVWVSGLRNPFGLATSSAGQVALTVNGPSGELSGAPGTGYDTVIASVTRGAAYQWPACYGYSHAVAPASSCPGGLQGPDWSSEASTVVPTGATFVDASGPAPYAGHLVFCTFNSGGRVLTAGSPHASVAPGPSNCRLDIKQGPDHALYYSDSGSIYRQAL